MSRCLHALHRVKRAAFPGLCALAGLVGVTNSAAAQIITTIAGTTDIAGRPARSISVRPAGIAVAPNGSVYVADSDHAQVLRFDPLTQSFTVVAGTAVAGYNGDGRPATSAQLNYPGALTFDPAGNLYIAESGNGRIRKVDMMSGEITTVAGGGWSTHDGDWAVNARLDGPTGIVVGWDGSIYVSEFEANRVRRITPSGQIFTIAGTGVQGASGDGGVAVNAQLSRPSALAFDLLGNLYISDQANWTIRVIDTGGIIRRFAGTGEPAQPVLFDGLPALESPLASVTAMSFDNQGNLIYTDHPIGRVRKIAAGTHIVSTIGGGGYEFEGVPATMGRIDTPYGLALANNGDIYVSSQNRFVMQRISGMTGTLEVVAGNGAFHYSGDGGSALLAQVMPSTSVVNTNGDVFIADASRIRKIDHNTGEISTYAGGVECCNSGDGGPAIDAYLYGNNSLTIDGSGNLYLSDYGAHRVRKINAATGIISHYAGTGYLFYGDGGPAINAGMSYIRDLAADAAGNLFILDDNSSRVRRVDAATGIITTIAGNGQNNGPLNDGLLATQVSLSYPEAVAVDTQGNVYISAQMRVRKVAAATGIITTIAGNGSWGDGGDGGLAVNASLRGGDLVADAAGNVFLTSPDSNRVRKVDAVTGIISTVAGSSIAAHSGDGGLAVMAELQNPRSVGLTGTGDLLVSETFHVRRIEGIAAVPTTGDTTPPNIVPVLTGPQLNASGWYVGEVRISWTITDPESTVTNTAGCASIGVLSDGEFTNLCTATSAGGTSSQTVSFKLDGTPPNVTLGVPTPAPNAAGWNNTNVSIPYTMSDNMSGVSTSSSQVTVSTEGANAQRTVGVNDIAGNTRTLTTPALKIDKTPPTATVAMPLNGGTYAFGSTVTASYTCSDSLSSVSTCLGTVPTGSPVDTMTSGSKTLLITMTDLAGNQSTKSVNYTVSPPDTTPPNIAYSMSAQPFSAAGWHNTNVTVSWSVSDAESSVQTSDGCTPTAVTSDTSGLTLTCIATSLGGTASRSVTIKRDTVPPTLVFGIPTPAPNAAGWNNTDVSIPYTKSDGLSGIPGSATATATLSHQGFGGRLNVGFSDNAGNWGSATTPAVNIDKIPPTITATRPANGATYALGSTQFVAYACGESHSGISSCIGTLPNGATVDTSSAGTKTFTITATDGAGNVASTTMTYTIGAAPPPPPPGTPTYCSSRGSTSTWEWIRSLQFGTWTNTSNNNGGFGDFTANAPISLQRGSNTIVVTPGFTPSSSYTENWRVWIDFDKDGTFATSEQVFAIATSSTLSTSFIVPSFAPSGTTRMRVSMKWGSAPSPCETFTYGEVEDYRVTIP